MARDASWFIMQIIGLVTTNRFASPWNFSKGTHRKTRIFMRLNAELLKYLQLAYAQDKASKN